MAELKDVCEESSPAAIAADAAAGAPTAADATAAVAADTPEGAPEASPAPDAVDIKAGPAIAVAAIIDAPKPEPKMPPVQQLAPEPAPAAPPVFLREHEQRTTPRPAVPPRGEAAKRPPVSFKARPAKALAGETRPKSRFTLLAATLALSAGVGAAAGTVGVPVIARIALGPATAAAPAPTIDAVAEVQALKGMIAQLTTDLGALRTAVEQSGKGAPPQIGKLAERLDRIERAQAEPAAKLAKIGEAIERLERRATAPANDITGTIPAPPPAPPEAKAKPTPMIIDAYVVRRVFDGVALVEGRRGIIEVEPGMSLPGAGRVEEIRRQDGRWVVVTNKGLILSPR
jgi:hypothetical protein